MCFETTDIKTLCIPSSTHNYDKDMKFLIKIVSNFPENFILNWYDCAIVFF